MRPQAASLVVLVLLGACVGPYTGTGVPPQGPKQTGTTTTPAESPARPVEETGGSETDRVMRFYARLVPMKGTELAHELEQSRAAFDADRSDINRMQLAVLLSLPGTSFRDDASAIALLNVFVKDKAREGAELRPLALWLHSHLVESRRTEEALLQQGAKLKEEQRRAEALQQKLDAILDMEMKMIERENLPKKK